MDQYADETRVSIVDEDQLEEISLMATLMIEATDHSGPLTEVEVDELLEQSAADLPVQRHDDV